MARREKKLHVVLETVKKPPPPASTAILQNRVSTCARQSRRQQSALSQLAMQIAHAFTGRPSPALAQQQQQVVSGRSLDNITQNARDLVNASDRVRGVQEAVERKRELARLLDVNEKQQQDLLRSIQNVRSRFSQMATVLRRRMRASQTLGSGTDAIFQTYNQTLSNAQNQMALLRQNLQQLRQNQIDINSQFDQTRQEAEAYDMATKQRQEIAQKLTLPARQQLVPRRPRRPLPRKPRRRRTAK